MDTIKTAPALLIGFAAETRDVETNAAAKLKRKKADWIIANDVSGDTGIGGEKGVMGGDANRVKILSAEGVEQWPELSKKEVARRLAQKIASDLAGRTTSA